MVRQHYFDILVQVQLIATDMNPFLGHKYEQGQGRPVQRWHSRVASAVGSNFPVGGRRIVL